MATQYMFDFITKKTMAMNDGVDGSRRLVAFLACCTLLYSDTSATRAMRQQQQWRGASGIQSLWMISK